MKLVLSPAAILDLQAIAEYTLQTWGVDQESRYLKGLWKRLEEIQAQPEIHKLRQDLTIGCRSSRYQKHVIFFAVQADTVQVIRILHGAMDFESHIPEELV